MRKILHFFILFLGAFCFATLTFGQNDRFAFAVTEDSTASGKGWFALRKLDLKTGQITKILLNGADENIAVFDATTKKSFKPLVDARYGNFMQAPFNTGVAAMAYDKINNRLYFTPMHIDQLRYIDLKTMKVFYVNDQKFCSTEPMISEEGKVITRMVITPDGNGYAISNDASIFIHFTTGKYLEITHLGSLVDDPSNGAVSINNKCSSWGGDMVADDEGGLYLFTARNSVYKINVETKTAKLVGNIKGLPAGFTVNGAVVTSEGKVLVSSALNNAAYFLVDHNNWTATEYKAAAGVFKSSDLANSNYLQLKPQNNNPKPLMQEIVVKTVTNEQGKITIYPNPVSNNQFTLQFGKIPTGNYNVTLTNVMGQSVMQRSVNVQAEDQVETIYLKPSMARGVYLIKVAGQNKKNMISEKLVVQ
jgi:hypothetical protein